MNAYTKLVAGVVFPIQERLKRHTTVSVRRSLESSQWLPPEAILRQQLVDLRMFLERIGAEVPYYRRLFSELHFKPRDVASLADLQRLPLLNKATIRANMKDLVREGASGLARFNTGGSSGEPLVFLLGRERVSHDVAAKWRATRWFGVDMGDPEIVLWGSPVELGAQDRLRQLRDRLMRTELLSAFDMSPANMDLFLLRIQAKRPRMLFGYPSSLALLAAHAKKTGFCVGDDGPRVAFVTSERLYPHQRKLIEEGFGCPVANGYGGRDAGFIAHECPKGRLHITAEDIIVETLATDGTPVAAGEAGEIVITHLRTADFPFLRYQTGDVGVLGQENCPCGRGLPTLERIEGRTTDFVVAQDGTVLHGLALIYVLRDMPEVGEFRIVQESLARTTVELVAMDDFDASHERVIREGFRQRLGQGVEVTIDVVDRLSREPSGKHRYVVSKVLR